MRTDRGGTEIGKLTNKRRRQITGSPPIRKSNDELPHQGSKEQQRRLKQLAKLEGQQS